MIIIQHSYAKVLGIPFPKITLDRAVEIIDREITDNNQNLFHVITVNPEITMACQKDSQLRSIVDRAGLITADGIGIVMVSRIKGGNLPERITGYDMLLRLLEKGNQKKWSFYFIGADPKTNKKVCEVIRDKYPKVQILGGHHGYFKLEDESRIVHQIGSLRPDVLIVALGAPYAEKWIEKHKSTLNAKVAIGVGGSLDVISGKVKETPEAWRKIYLEWLFRLIQQPSRWKRQLILPRFAIKAILIRENKN